MYYFSKILLSFTFYPVSKCLDGWIWFKSSCNTFGKDSMDAKAGVDFLVVDLTFVTNGVNRYGGKIKCFHPSKF